MWSKPFIRQLPGSTEEVAVFLIDTQVTALHPARRAAPGRKASRAAVSRVPCGRSHASQGMFDSSTSQMLTACIFGLSTLISSYQIYNVGERVQEDNLQHLALFSEYGRCVAQRGVHCARGRARVCLCVCVWWVLQESRRHARATAFRPSLARRALSTLT